MDADIATVAHAAERTPHEPQVEPGYIEEPTLIWKIQSSEMRKACFHTEAAQSCTSVCELGAACRRPIAEWLRYR